MVTLPLKFLVIDASAAWVSAMYVSFDVNNKLIGSSLDDSKQVDSVTSILYLYCTYLCVRRRGLEKEVAVTAFAKQSSLRPGNTQSAV